MVDSKEDEISALDLSVTLVKATGLPRCDPDSQGGRADPYVIFRIGKDKKKSQVQPNTLDPVWGQEFRFDAVGRKAPGDCLEILVVDKDKMSSDDKIGTVNIKLADILAYPDESVERPFKIKDNRGNERGTLVLKFHAQSVGAHDRTKMQERITKRREQLKELGKTVDEKPVDDMTYFQLRKVLADLNKRWDAEQNDGKNDGDDEQAFIDKLKELGAKVVIFDMDRTACKLHSGGVLPNSKVTNYINNHSEDFKRIVPKIIENGFQLAVATFTDNRYYDKFPKQFHKAGDDLVRGFLKGVFKDEEIVKKFTIVAYFPDLHPEARQWKRNKAYHIAKIMKDLDIKEKNEIVLFDDTAKNIDDAKNEPKEQRIHAFKANPREGFKLRDLLQPL